ncbi:uncharacterized protein LOC111012080 [Momordica charantia]|uniref:Uncharacterized protein LOC111012080 n=1 Tax=Momordica charantia TaxID=3673 RepID=A0A6J1CJ47_MOMCH|nr:uncharacterized protein LOC111012080 [Momordica charantia]
MGCGRYLPSIILVYADDVIVTGNNDRLIASFVSELDTKFALKDLSAISYFLDVDWASNIHDGKSVASVSLVSWLSKKQTTVARSSIGSEYQALAHASTEIVLLKQLLGEIGVRLPSVPTLRCNNISVGAFDSNPVFHARIKYIEIDVHFLRDQVIRGALEV